MAGSAEGPDGGWIEIEEAVHDEELEQETAKIQVAPAPVKPPPGQVEEHRITHCPYRSWCDHCGRGRGLGEQRGRHAGRHHAIPRVGIDYWYVTSDNIKKRKELQETYPLNLEGDQKLEDDRRGGRLMKCIIIRCHESKAILAHCVPCKGADEDGYVVELIVQAVAWMGHTKLILKSDNEVALLSLVKRALEAVRHEVPDVITATDEQSAEYESQSNGGTEVGIRAVRGRFRTIKFCTEERIGNKMPIMHPLTSWLIEHVATLLDVMNVGVDGMTA